MSPRKKKKPQAAQNLIDSLLDEKSVTGSQQKRASRISEDTNDKLVDFNTGDGANSFVLTDTGIGKVPDPIVKAEREAKTDKLPIPSKTSTASVASLEPSSAKAHELVTTTGDGGLKSVTPQHETEVAGAAKHPPPALPGKSGVSPEPTMRLSDSVHEARVFSAGEETIQNPTRQSEPKSKGFNASVTEPAIQEPSIDRLGQTDVKTVLRLGGGDKSPSGGGQRPQAPSPQFGGYSSAEAALKQSESLRIAQSRLSELEAELVKLRRDNENLAAAGETLRRRSDELLSKCESLDLQKREVERIAEEEKKVFRGQLQQKDREIVDFRNRLEELESRLELNFKKIRVRERELEHRLEIVRMESATLVSTKDKMLLELKRQIDQLTHENDFGKQKAQEVFNQYKDKQETIRRVVRALRIALTILEGDEDGSQNASPLKKAE